MIIIKTVLQIKYIFPLYTNAHIVTGFVGKQLIQNEIIKLKLHSV